MNGFANRLRTHARVQFLRHIQSPAIWWLAIAAPIAARYLVPHQEAGYSVLAVNNAKLTLDPAVIGLQLGVVMAIILTPLAYIFLRAGPTRHGPWQAEDVTPARRTAQMLGHWVADTGALWILMFALAFAGVILSFFRLPLSDIRPVQTIAALCIIAAPALAVIAGVRIIFSTRPKLHGALGDVLFFILWMVMIVSSAAFFGPGQTSSPFVDVLGFAAPIAGATDMPISSLYLGGAPDFNSYLKIDAMAGVLNSGFLVSRLFWVGVAAALVAIAGFFFKPRKHKFRSDAGRRAAGPEVFTAQPVAAAAQTASPLSLWMSELSGILSPIWILPALGVIAAAGAVLPLRGMVGPALALLLIFPLTQHAARWRGKNMDALTRLSPVSPTAQLVHRLGSSVVLSLMLCGPAMGRMIATGNPTDWADVAAIGLGLPVIAVALGHLTRGPVAGRLVLLILWYGYLNVGGPTPALLGG